MPTAARDPAATRLAIAATTGNLVCVTAAISATFGTFLVPLSQDLGWSRAAVSGVLGLIAVVAAVSYPLIGRMMDMLGARAFILGGNLMLGLLIISLSQTTGNIWLFYAQFGAIGLAGATCASPMIAKIVTTGSTSGAGSCWA